MKIAPVLHALEGETWCRPILVHTGQHYDESMSDAFFRDLRLPKPDYHLDIGSGSHAEQTDGVMVAYEKICLERRPDRIVVVGDVNSTMACALVAAKSCIPLAHLEAGLRSRDRTMPEEINRLVTDAISDLLWTPSPDGDENLRAEGVPESRIERVGNIMLDSFEMLRGPIEAAGTRARFGLSARDYGVVTLHRPANVDSADVLATIVDQLTACAREIDLVFAVHPRTRKNLMDFDLIERLEQAPGLCVTTPLGYVAFMSLVLDATLVVTDSGGIQEETTYLDIPCLTVRDNTERPITVTQGTNRLVRPGDIQAAVARVLNGDWPRGRRPELWDGRTAGRIVDSLKRHLRDGVIP